MHRLNEFCDTTGLKALTWAHKAESRKEKYFWVLVALTGLVMATWDISLAVDRFSQKLTSSKVTVLMNNSFSLESPTICLYVMLSKELLQHNGLNLANSSEVSKFLHDFDDVNLTQFIGDRLNLLAERQPIEGQIDNWLDNKFATLILLISTVLSNVLKVELATGKHNTNKEFLWGTVVTLKEEEIGHLDNLTSEGIMQTFDYLITKNITLASLLKNVASGLCYMLEFRVEKLKFSRSGGEKHLRYTNLCLPERMSWFGAEPFYSETIYDMLCISVQRDFINLTTPYDTVTFQLDKNRFPEPIMSDSANSAGIYLDPWGNKVSTINDMNVLYVDQGIFSNVGVQLIGHFKPLPSSQKPCSKVEIRTDCRLRYMLAYMRTNCLCTPLFSGLVSAQPTKGFPYCQERADINSTSLNIPGYNATPECVKGSSVIGYESIKSGNCLPLCEQRIFNYIHLPTSDTNNSQITKLSIWVDPFMYPLFEDVYLTDPKQFLAQLGGSLSLWLGANFLVLLHSCVFLIKWPVEVEKGLVKSPTNKRLTVKQLEAKLVQVGERMSSVEDKLQNQLDRLERLEHL